jgi:hypothetical protein
MNRPPPPHVARTRRVAAAILLLLAGCGSPAEEGEEAHHLPAHHPGTFRRAVEELARRGEACAAQAATGPDTAAFSAPLPEAQLGELSDIARWLPELAADTALPRREWELVRAESRRLGAVLAGAASAGEGVGPAAVAAAVTEAVGTLRDIQATLATDAFQEEEP